uniref:C-type lectin domain-containing protein n=1 Tax=Sparus aurata TaxID=8175 RepID=A0A671XSW4_SPAAU
MKTLALLLLSLTVALGVPAPPPGVPQNPVLAEGDLRPLLGDVLPVQGHVVVKDPAPQLRLGSQEEKEKLAPAPVDVQQGQQVKVKPEAVEEQKGGVWTEVKVEQEVKEVEVEPQVKAEAEVKVEPEVKEVKVEPQVKAEAEVKVEPEVNAEAEAKVEQEVNVEPEEVAPELEENPDFKLESEEKVEPEVMARLEVNENPEAEIEPDVQKGPEPEDDPMFNEEQGAQEEYQVQMNLEDEPEAEFERHIDMEGRYGMMPEPIMELEPEDDDNVFGEELGDTELSEVENSLRGAFQNEEGHAEERVLGAEPIMELEPLVDDSMFGEEPSDTELDQEERSLRGAFKNEEPAIQTLSEEEGLDEERFLGAEPIMELEPLDEDMFGEEPSNPELAETEKSLKEAFRSGDPAIQSLPEEEGLEADTEFERHIDMEGKNEMVGETTMQLEDEDSMFGDELSNATRGSYCPGVIYEGKCYLFFRGPKKAADAEFFCQDHFPGGHLASITSQHIHLMLMELILDQNGSCTRTWVGGLRYLDTDRFIWLDGSRWNYSDWLMGEPNNTSNKENCLEVLSCALPEAPARCVVD